MVDEEAILVLLVENDRLARDNLQAAIAGTDGYGCVGSSGSVEEALAMVLDRMPDVILLDVDLPGTSGPDGVEPLKRRYPQAIILMLMVHGQEDLVFQAIVSGASGALPKEAPPERLLEAIHEAHRGGAPISPEIARKVIGAFQRAARLRRAEPDLSHQERAALILLAEGHTYQAAADELGVSINTVRNYVRAIYSKLHVHSKSEAVSKALRGGLI